MLEKDRSQSNNVDAKINKEIFFDSLKKLNEKIESQKATIKQFEKEKKEYMEAQKENELLKDENEVLKTKLSRFEDKGEDLIFKNDLENNMEDDFQKSHPELLHIKANHFKDREQFESRIDVFLDEKKDFTEKDIIEFLDREAENGNYVYSFDEVLILKIMRITKNLDVFLMEKASTEARESISFAQVISYRDIDEGLKYFGASVRSEINVCKQFVDTDRKNLKHIDLSSEEYLNLFFYFLAKDISVFQYLSPGFKDDPEFYYYGMKLGTKRIPYNLKLDLKKYPLLTLFISQRTLERLPFICNIIEDNGYLLKYLPEKMIKEEKYILSGLRSYPQYIERIYDDVKENREFILKAYKANPEISKFRKIDITDEDKQTKENYKLKSSFLKKLFSSND